MVDIIKKQRYRIMMDIDFLHLYNKKKLSTFDHVWISEALKEIIQTETNNIDNENLVNIHIQTYKIPFSVHEISIDVFNSNSFFPVNDKLNDIISNISDFILHLKSSEQYHIIDTLDVYASYLAFFEKVKIEEVLKNNDINTNERLQKRI